MEKTIEEKALAERRLKVLNDTVSHYNSKNRAVVQDVCVYHPLEYSEGCAIGRLIADKELCKSLAGSVSMFDVFCQLPRELQELGQTFLTNLQCLHDATDHWDASGISALGQTEVDKIKANFELN